MTASATCFALVALPIKRMQLGQMPPRGVVGLEDGFRLVADFQLRQPDCGFAPESGRSKLISDRLGRSECSLSLRNAAECGEKDRADYYKSLLPDLLVYKREALSSASLARERARRSAKPPHPLRRSVAPNPDGSSPHIRALVQAMCKHGSVTCGRNPCEDHMKSFLVAASFIAVSASSFAATDSTVDTHSTQFLSGKASLIVFDAGNRKGSKRVGGTGRSGKGSHYVGGRR